MSFIRALGVWLITYSAQYYVGISSHWHLDSNDYYVFYAVATIMMVVSYVMGRIEDIKDGDGDDD